MTAILNLSPLDGRYQEKLHDLRPFFSEMGLIKYRVIIEIRWLIFLINEVKLPQVKPLSNNALNFLENILQQFNEHDALRVKEIENEINHDVKAVEYFIKEKISQHAELSLVSELIHFGCTSEDINNLAYALMLKESREKVLLVYLNQLITTLKTLAHENADVAMLARTHGQAASPTTLGKEIANVVARLQRQITQLQATPILGKLNGATGNFNALHSAYPAIDWMTLTANFISQLDLQCNPYTTQIEPHDYMAEIFMCIMRINIILIDFNRDMWGYIALNYFQQKAIQNEVGSSTMPHKINPIDFENAEGNLGLANALLDHLSLKLPISRWQRDLSDSTVLRNVGVALGYALLAYQSTLKGLKKSSPCVEKMKADLDAHWEVLAEPIQMMLRSEGVEKPYEKLKLLTRGKKITKDILEEFIRSLSLSQETQQAMLNLTPENYIGFANLLAKKI